MLAFNIFVLEFTSSEMPFKMYFISCAVPAMTLRRLLVFCRAIVSLLTFLLCLFLVVACWGLCVAVFSSGFVHFVVFVYGLFFRRLESERRSPLLAHVAEV